MLNQGRFSLTGVSDYTDHLPFFDRKVDILNCHLDKRSAFRIDMAQMFCPNDCHLVTFSLLCVFYQVPFPFLEYCLILVTRSPANNPQFAVPALQA